MHGFVRERVELRSLKKKLSDEPTPSDEHSFGERFRAWWDGSELEAKPKAPTSERIDAREMVHAGAEASDESDRFTPIDRSSPWPETRQKVAQMVWGDGFVVPGNAESTTELVNAFGLDSSTNMLEIGSGVGGGTRAIASQFGAYVTGFDIEPELGATATVQAEVHSLDRKAAVHPLDPDNAEFKPQFYTGVLIRETLYRIADKKAFLNKIVAALKPGGHLLIIDLFFADDADASEMDRWRDGERSEAYGWQIEEARDVLGKLSVEIRVTVDESDAYCAKILDTWNNFVAHVGDNPLPDDLVLPLADEAEFWTRRTAAIRSGNLKLHRMTCLKSKPVR